jgi:hypothetical protein
MVFSSSVVPLGLARLKRSSNWRSLENWNWRERITCISHGVKIALQVTEPAVLLPVKLRLPPGWHETRDSEAEPEYSLVVGNEVAPPGLDGLHLLFRGNSLISAAYKLEPVLGALESDLDRVVASRAAPERIFVVAAVVGWRGRAIMVCGGPQSGTSTLIAALLRAGAIYYSEPYAVLDRDGWVHPYTRPLWLCAASQVNPVRYRPEELNAKVGTHALPVGTIVFSNYRPGARPKFVPLTPAAVSAELMANAVAARSYPQAAQSAIGKALAGAWILKGVRGEADDVVDLLLGPGRKRSAR